MSAYDPLPSEYSEVEKTFFEQLKDHLGWQHIEGDKFVPEITERENFREVVLKERLKEALKRINLDEDGKCWLTDEQVTDILIKLDRISGSLMEANEKATEMLLKGVLVERDNGPNLVAKLIDFENPESNDFLAMNQFRVEEMKKKDAFVVPDLVLFVNGLPLVVIECKSPATTNPMEEGVEQLRRYSNMRGSEEAEGNEKLFHWNQLLISTCKQEARCSTIGAELEHYLEWKDPCPLSRKEAEVKYGKKLNSQQMLVQGMLTKTNLLDIVRNFSVFVQEEGKTIKIVTRYQQFRAVQKTIERLRTGKTREKDGDSDKRGGIVWHTQGSGKSLTMVFLVKKMRCLSDLKKFKVVAVTDRRDLEKQLMTTMAVTGETVRPSQHDRSSIKGSPSARVRKILQESGSDVVMCMIQKHGRNEDLEPSSQDDELAEVFGKGIMNESENIVVLVDEAHRNQTGIAHACLRRALPNAALIGFTGTPIFAGKAGKATMDIFGDYIDRYTIDQSEKDGATVPIVYEGRVAPWGMRDKEKFDQLFDDMFRSHTQEEIEKIKQKYGTKGNVLEAPAMIEAKASDMLRHYIVNIMPNGFKAQVVATSREAAVRYFEALEKARKHILERVDVMDRALDDLPDDRLDDEARFLLKAKRYRSVIERMEFLPIISGKGNDAEKMKRFTGKWSEAIRTRFKKPLLSRDESGEEVPAKQDNLCFLIVKSMLLTGFDAPVEQVMYLDKSMRGAELLQAIARVNRTKKNKTRGFVVDYYGIGLHLKDALKEYTQEDVQGAMVNMKDEVPILKERHSRVLAIFHAHDIEEISDTEACIELLENQKIRADFVVKFKEFLQSMDIILPRPEALPYARDMKILGFIHKSAANRYRDEQLNILGCGQKVRELIDEYIESKGINPKVPPISILDENFENQVQGKVSARAKASEMEHAARYHIKKHFDEDPVYYKKLSERLDSMLKDYEQNWEQLVLGLSEFIQEVRAGRQEDQTGLDPKTQAPFLGVIIEEAFGGVMEDEEHMKKLCKLTVDLVEKIRLEVGMVGFWRNPYMQNSLRGRIFRYLNDNLALDEEKKVESISTRFMELAHTLHSKLTE